MSEGREIPEWKGSKRTICCVNMTGYREKLLVIEKSGKFRCLKGVHLDTLQVEYKINSKA